MFVLASRCRPAFCGMARCSSPTDPTVERPPVTREAPATPTATARSQHATRRVDAGAVAFLAALVAFGSRFASKILTTSLGWASTLLFGRVPASRQILLLGITFGSVIWIVMLIGLIVPDVGAFLLLLVPPQNYVSDDVIRLVMLVGVLVVPAVIGGATLALTRGSRGPRVGRRGHRSRLPGDRAPGAAPRLPRRARDLSQRHQLRGDGPTPTSRWSSSPARTTRSRPTSTRR